MAGGLAVAGVKERAIDNVNGVAASWSDTRTGWSIGLATGLYGISFGALATASGLDVWQAMGLAAVMFSGGSQFAFVGVIGMLLASGATVLDVLLRWLASTGVTALNEIVSMTFAVAVAACIPAGLASGVGVTIDVIEKQLSARSAARLRALGAVALLVAFAVLTWRMGIFAESLRMQGRTTVILTLPQAPFIWTTTVLLGASTFVQAIAAWDHVRAASAARARRWSWKPRPSWLHRHGPDTSSRSRVRWAGG